tara:strand:- start:3305 stop:3472 length:168 start_codon:yes stop_codon:yes gene_type:complete
MSKFIEYPKPPSLANTDVKLYYMYSNQHDVLGESYQEITNDEVLEIAYKVYIKQN